MTDRKRSPSALNGYEQIALLKQPNPRTPTGLRNLCIIILMLKAGLRVNEVINLRRDDFDWERKRLYVRSSGAASARVLKIGSEELDLLKRWRDKLSIDTLYFFTTLDGKQLKDRYIREMVKRMARKAGLEKDVYPHLLRHTFAVDFIKETGDMSLLQRALGHRNSSATQNYARLLLEELNIPHNGSQEGERSGFPLEHESEIDKTVLDDNPLQQLAGGIKEINGQTVIRSFKNNHEKQLSIFNSRNKDSGSGKLPAGNNNHQVSAAGSGNDWGKNGGTAGGRENIKQEEQAQKFEGEEADKLKVPVEGQIIKQKEPAREEAQTIEMDKMEKDSSERVRIPPLKCCCCSYILHFQENCPQCGASFESIIRHWRSQI